MGRPEIERNGDNFLLTYPDQGLELGIGQLRESSDGLHTEVTIASTKESEQGHLHGPARLNLVSTQSQTTLVKALEKRAPDTDWAGMIVQASAIVVHQYRQGAPAVSLFDGDEPGAVEYLVPGLMPLGETTCIYGDGESAKSLIAVLLATCVSTGHALPWGVRPARRANVLYLDWETCQSTVKRRIWRVTDGLQPRDLPSVYYRPQFRPLADDLPAIQAEIRRIDAGLVVVDSLGFACSGSLNEDATARDAMNALRQLSPVSRMVVHHVSKEAAERTHGAVKPFGNSYFWNGMRSGWEVRRAEGGSANAELALFHRKSNDGQHQPPISLRLSFEDPDGPIRFATSELGEVPELAAHASLAFRIRAALRDGAKDTKSLSEETGASEATVRQTVRRMDDVTRIEAIIPGSRAAVWGLRAHSEAA